MTASGGDGAAGVGIRWAGPMVSPPLTILGTLRAQVDSNDPHEGRRGGEGRGREGGGRGDARDAG